MTYDNRGNQYFGPIAHLSSDGTNITTFGRGAGVGNGNGCVWIKDRIDGLVHNLVQVTASSSALIMHDDNCCRCALLSSDTTFVVVR